MTLTRFAQVGDVAVYSLDELVAFLLPLFDLLQIAVTFVQADIEVIQDFVNGTSRNPAVMNVFW